MTAMTLVSSRVPASVQDGECVLCEWELANPSPEEVVLSFYVASKAPLAALACPGGRTRPGRFHGSATIAIGPGGKASVWALLEPRLPGEHPIQVAIFTRHETIEASDTFVVRGPLRVAVGCAAG